jgi:hypothetical protein
LLSAFNPSVATHRVKAGSLIAVLPGVAVLQAIAGYPALRLDADQLVWAFLSALHPGLARQKKTNANDSQARQPHDIAG